MKRILLVIPVFLGLLLLASSARVSPSVRVDGMTLLDEPAGPGSHPALLTAPEAAPSSTIGCGDTITSDTTLTSDLTDCPGNGLIIGADNITLDCQGHTIDGDGSGGGDGIVVSGRSWDTIKNCTVTDFAYGISLSWSSNNTLTDNTANSNHIYGFFVSDSSSNTLTGSTANGNRIDGIYLQASYTNTNNTLSGSTVRDNVGAGVQLGGNFNTLSGSTIRNNGGAGVYVFATNTLNSSVVCSNKLDISGIGSNSGDDNTCMSTNNWNDDGTTGCTSPCPQTVCYCSSCSECNEKLAADCPTVKLTADIVDQSGTCITQRETFNGEVFDCQGHTIDGDGSGFEGIDVGWRSWDTIKNCTVTDFGGGISLNGSSNITLTDNTANSNDHGFFVSDSDSNTLTGSTASGNLYDGIYLWSSSNNTVSGSTIRDNRGTGLYAYGVNNSIWGSTIRNNGGTGLSLPDSGATLNSNVVCSNKLDISSSGFSSGDDNTCMSTNNWNDSGSEGCSSSCPAEPVCYCSSCSECNEKLAADCPVVRLTADIADQSGSCISQGVTFNGEVFDCQGHTIDGDGSGPGISVSGSGCSWNTIKNCVVTDFSYGIELPSSSNNTLTNNTVSGNLYDGINLWNSFDNTLSGSKIRDNSGTGLYLMDSDNNLIYNNYFSNAQNVSASGTNAWNIAKTAGTNIFGGPYLGGNYWSDYAGADTNRDGLGDTSLPYNASGKISNGGDYLPLVPVSGSPVGGIQELPDTAELALERAQSSHASSRPYAATAAVALGVVLLGAGAWYARRRWPGRR